jgi:hypothetical protein
MRIASLLMVTWLGLTACSAKRGSPPAPPASRTPPASPASRYTEADSAAVFGAVAHEILFFDEAREAVERKFSPRRVPDGEPLVVVRIGALPTGAWAAPTVQRLRSRRWFRNWTAVDSTRALAGLEDRPTARWRKPIPIALEMGVAFRGDTAFVAENWIWYYCRTEPRSWSVLNMRTHLFERTPSGWQKTGERQGPLVDLASCG